MSLAALGSQSEELLDVAPIICCFIVLLFFLSFLFYFCSHIFLSTLLHSSVFSSSISKRDAAQVRCQTPGRWRTILSLSFRPLDVVMLYVM